MNIIQLYQDYSVTFVTEGHKHARPGWVNTACPWCTGEHEGYHLGYNEDGNYYFCWRCGWHPIVPTLSRLLKLGEQAVRILVKNYGLLLSRTAREPIIKNTTKPFSLPTNIGPLLSHHKLYLTGRGFDPERLEQIWGLQSAGPVSKLDHIDYKNRIIIPFYWDGEIVTFDSRSTSLHASHEKRYKACMKDREMIPHKEILYGRQEEWRETGICVEGPTDVWRLGTASFATSGIQYTPQQVRIMARVFKRVFVMFDNEVQAQAQSDKIVAELRFRGVEAYGIQLEKDPDPGSMKQADADYLVKQLIK